MEEKNFIFAEFQSISNKLKKRRILTKPNATEASQQFENLGVTCEVDDLPQYAGLCYQTAADCQSALGNASEQAYLLLKACRQFMSSYLRYVHHHMVYTDENLQQALVCYRDCLNSYLHYQDSNKPNKNIIVAGICMEMGDTMRFKLGRVEEAIEEYKKTLKLLDRSPVEKMNCLQRLVSSKIELGHYDDALKYTNELVEETQKIPLSGLRESVTKDCEINRILLLLILQPTPQQITPQAASILEKYAWVETVDNSEVSGLQTSLANNAVVDEKLFVRLQSLVMACQYGDKEGLIHMEDELAQFFKMEQRDLLRILVELKLKK